MATFPKLNITAIKDSDYFPEQKVEFGNLYDSAEPEFTRALKIFELKIEGLEIADRQSLSTFFKSNQGSSFLFIDPETKDTYTVKFYDMDKLDFDRKPGKTSSTNITLKEVM